MNIIQFGDGNFMRGFIDFMYEKSARTNELSIYSIQSRASGKGAEQLQQQDCQFHVFEAGLIDGEVMKDIYPIHVIQEAMNPYADWARYERLLKTKQIDVIFSNTTEAGIVNLKESFKLNESCVAYPAKLVQLLYLQFKSGFTQPISVLPLELIQKNGDTLKAICDDIINDWGLEARFLQWYNDNVSFYNTLVDRIVSGYPKGLDVSQLNLAFEDPLLTQVEPYYLFAIEADESLDCMLKLSEANPQVTYTNNLAQISNLKIELLNATHTMLANIGVYKGILTVKEAVTNEEIFTFIHKLVMEGVIATSNQYTVEQGKAFYEDVLQRFRNPFIAHYLKDIRLNNSSKMQSRLNPILARILASGCENLVEAIAKIYVYAFINDQSAIQVKNVEPQQIIQFYHVKFTDETKAKAFLVSLANVLKGLIK